MSGADIKAFAPLSADVFKNSDTALSATLFPLTFNGKRQCKSRMAHYSLHNQFDRIFMTLLAVPLIFPSSI